MSDENYKDRALKAEITCLNQSKQLEQIGDIIHYPDAWDTACYDSLQSAMRHLIQCGEMAKPEPV